MDDVPVATLLKGRLQLEYELRKSVVLDSGTDVNGVWWIEVDAGTADILTSLQRSHFEQADDYDLVAFKKDADRWFAPQRFGTGHQLFVAEMPLGQGTACEKMLCNVMILIKLGDRNVIVQIFSI